MSEKWPIGVFTSIDAGLGVQFPVVVELGIPTIQLHAPGRASRTPDAASEFTDKLDKNNIRLTCVFAGFDGESYADIPTVEKTVGLVPEETRAARLKEVYEISDFARLLGCEAIGLHLGFVPHDTSSQAYKDIVTVTRQLCDHAQSNVQAVHLETGQETAEALLQFIQAVDRPNLFINFDPANMILYGTGDPIEALKLVGRYVKSIHCKDGKWSDQPGVTWGQEVRLGDGDVGIERYLQTLKEIGYDGPLTIEREIPQEANRQKAEIQHARDLLVACRDNVRTGASS
jgi:sugar phosphate isomerase/epimerase